MELPLPFGMSHDGGGGFSPNMSGIGGGLAQLLSSLFNHGKNPYDKYGEQYKQYGQQAIGAQNPFYNAGIGAMGDYKGMLDKMSHPDEFINNLMGQYQESPFAKYQQSQGMRAAKNIGSSSGLTGSTPLMNMAQQNAQNISSGDMNSWLQNALGVNKEALGGYGNMMGMGQHSADQMSSIFENMGKNMGESAYGSQDYNNRNRDQMIQGIMRMLMGGGGF